ncbi:branched-chain amino acid transport system permease protein [Pseudochelatococcus lubricantis]|uniref:Branched-chain amino acid transport system permease protein n=1 Tax=Pseudochelatococcus lubricantis TaxID=1538102 RepID=A0ABX0UVD9_9HYPH|nr:branched-chain amino acid ABC transporter permease [Pseudochelatococcus lubricantis]NIJ56727.1 branched-chain amino acid transport system permease protein [Pseudochelatococcus lubricantis]
MSVSPLSPHAPATTDRGPAERLLRCWFPVLALIVPLFAVAIVSDLAGSVMIQRTVTEALIRIVVVVGIYVFVGNTGVISFGSVTFMAIAAYATGWQTCCEALKPITMPGLPEFLRDHSYSLFPAALAAVALAALAAFVTGLVLMRMSGLAASISTLAVLFIVNVVYSNWDSVTMGTASMVGLPRYVTLWVALGAAVLAIVVAWLYQSSRFGLAVRATRADEVAAAACGVSLYRARLLAFTLSGALMGLGGVLTAHFLGTVSINSFFLKLTFIALAMLVVGGMGSLAGAVAGVVVTSVVIDVFRRLESGFSIAGANWSLPAGTQELVLAGVMLLILIYRKDGLMGGREFHWPSNRGKIAGT